MSFMHHIISLFLNNSNIIKKIMESTGSTTSKSDRNENSLPKDMYRFIPSIGEQGLAEKSHRKKLQALFDKYLKP